MRPRPELKAAAEAARCALPARRTCRCPVTVSCAGASNCASTSEPTFSVLPFEYVSLSCPLSSNSVRVSEPIARPSWRRICSCDVVLVAGLVDAREAAGRAEVQHHVEVFDAGRLDLDRHTRGVGCRRAVGIEPDLAAAEHGVRRIEHLHGPLERISGVAREASTQSLVGAGRIEDGHVRQLVRAGRCRRARACR